MSNKPGRMKVGSIGDGLEGVILVKALAGAGHIAEAISVTADESIERADSLLPKVEMVSMQEVVERCDLIIMAMDSAATEEAVTGLAQLGYFAPGKIVLHCAPDRGYAILASAARAGAIPIALHPIVDFTGTSVDLLTLQDSVCAITAPDSVLPIAQGLAMEIGSDPIVIAEYQRPAFAEAYSSLNNFPKMIVSQAISELEAEELPRVVDLVAPMARAAVERALREGGFSPNPEDFES